MEQRVTETTKYLKQYISVPKTAAPIFKSREIDTKNDSGTVADAFKLREKLDNSANKLIKETVKLLQ